MNTNIRVVRPPKVRFSWVAEILKLEVGGDPLIVEAVNAKRVRPLLSREIKVKAPERVHTTDAESLPGYLIVTRTA